jgi:hypothetical protein
MDAEASVLIGGFVVGRVSPLGRALGFESALAEPTDERSQFKCRRHGRSRPVVAETAELNEAVAAYYPVREHPGVAVERVHDAVEDAAEIVDGAP